MVDVQIIDKHVPATLFLKYIITNSLEIRSHSLSSVTYFSPYRLEM
jgi:hypothetical protein